ncbi:hypothetical protein Taro_033099 [Colocasia esculenta]|uniref:DNA topoisomerase 2 n=1 Tax=Colocasia esculenta TaxID=4460 RepID=A0A843VWU3_COLES|nr:hypothetical protein [Colocasia esculenta]
MAIDKKRPLQSSSAHNVAATGDHATAGDKTIEETYQKKTQLEHILLRPDTYIGSVERHTQALWVYEGGQMMHRSVTYVPGLYKIFDEILVNAADNKQRDPSMDALRVEIDQAEGRICVYNNGDGIPVEVHREEGVYVPELIFGHLLTSSNYDDAVKKTTGGRNGYGAKLTNIFSTEFVVETADGRRQKKYKQVFTNNMGIKGEPIISKCKEGENWTKITFKPDLAKFNMTELEDDVVALMKKRVVDLAGTLGKTVKVELNGQRLPVKTFQQYVDLYLKSADKGRLDSLPRIYEANDRWEVCVSLSEGQFQQVSFVNRIATIKGGSHVEYITSQITSHVTAIVQKKNKNANLKPHTVKNHLWVFVNALIDNPAFDSQTKETLTTRQGSFGSKCELSSGFLKKVAESGIVDILLSWADFKQSKDLKKTDGTKRQRLVGLTKLEDANEAGGRNSEKCTLILTEGDSAKALAVGISIVGRDYYGVFPLRGKLLNVREASHKQIMENTEIQNIKQILGLQHGKQYDSVKSLRYGHLMIMTDQDHDGSHIKGLLINFIHSFWPSLLRIPTFLVEFITPIVKATKKGSKKDVEVLSFYSMPEYEDWKERLGEGTKAWKIKYYKGLGTSDSNEGREYFRNLGKHKKDFVWADEEDGNAIELAFSKKKIEERKNWLRHFEPGTCLDQRLTHIKYSEFVNKELILFSVADLQRSIPSMVDGLKPGQRKILYCSLKKKIVEDIKVSQFSGYVSEHSAYHHGEASLASTILGMANDFLGSNNINLLVPSGQFGTRLRGGKDAAHPRYMPIIPMVLVNGSEGIGTGWSSFIPNYNPRDIVANLRRLLNDEPMDCMVPWYKGFTGLIEKTSSKEAGVTYTLSGIIEEVDNTTLKITELPVRRWTQDYKEFLESMMTGNDKIKEPFIKDYRQYSDDRTVHFDVTLSEENMNIARQEGLLKKFKLTSTISTSNMHLFDANGAAWLGMLGADLLRLDNKVRFILAVVQGEIEIKNRKRADLFIELQHKGFTPLPNKTKGRDAVVVEETEEDNTHSTDAGKGYEYLLSMPIGSLTYEKIEQLLGEKGKLENEIVELRASSVKSLWLRDLDAFEESLEVFEKEREEEWERTKVKGERKVGGATKVQTKQRKKNSTSAAAGAVGSTASAAETAPKATKGRGPKKPAAKKRTEVESEEDEEILELKERLARYDINSHGHSVTETDDATGAGPVKRQSSRAVATSTKKALSSVTEISDDEDNEEMETIDEGDDENFGMDDDVLPPAKGQKPAGGRKPAPTRAKKVTAATAGGSKRAGANSLVNQKLITEVLKPVENAQASPEKKVRKIRPSPFNKKSSSILGRSDSSISGNEQMESSPESAVEEAREAPMARARPQRASRAAARYVLSDSESDEEPVDDSDFEEEDD